MRTDLIVVDGYFEDPSLVRREALEMNFFADTNYYQGQRTRARPRDEDLKNFERLLQKRITKWDYPVNGAFQFTTAEDRLVYHVDTQQWAGIVFLTPEAPVSCGTSFFKSRTSLSWRMDPALERPGLSEAAASMAVSSIFAGGYFDSTRFEEVDRVGNVYNRLVLWNAKLIHAASRYFGSDLASGRLFQIFFFDVE